MKNNRKLRQQMKIAVLCALSFSGLVAIEARFFRDLELPQGLLQLGFNLCVVYFLLIKNLFDQKAKIIPLRRKNGP